MVTTTAGTVSDPSSNKENRESQNKEDPKNEHSMKANSVDNSKPLPEDKLNSITDGVTQGMSNDQAATNVDSTQNSRSETATTTVSSNVDGSSNGFPEPNSCIPNGPVESFSNVPQPNYQTFTNASSFGGQAGPSVRPSASSYVPSQFSKNHQSSTTPTLNKLLMSPSRYPHNYLNNSNPSSNNHQKPNQGHMQSWDQRTPQEQSNSGSGERINFDPSKDNSTPAFDPHRHPDPSYGLPSHPTNTNQLRYPSSFGNKQLPYGQLHQYNATAHPPTPASSGYFHNHPTPPPNRYSNYSNYPNYNSQSQSQYFPRHSAPTPAAETESQQGTVRPPQSQEPIFQQPREHMMSPNRRTPQPTAAPSPLGAAQSPHMLPRTPASQLRGPSPAPASPAFMGPPGGTPLGSPMSVRPGTPHQQPHPARPPDVDNNNVVPSPAPVTPGYPTGYKSSSSQSPYPSQPSSYPQPGSLSSQQQPVQYPSGQPNSNLPPVQHLDPNAPPATPSAGLPSQPVHGTTALAYNQSSQQPPSYQQPGGHNLLHYGNEPRLQHYNQGYPPPGPQTDKRSVGQAPSPASDLNRRGAVAAAAAAMAAAAHSAQPGHVPGQRPPAPSYHPQATPIQQARPQHLNYSNMQPSNDGYPSPKPYPQMPPPRMPLSHPHRIPGQSGLPPPSSMQNNYRMQTPGSAAPTAPGYRHPPISHSSPGNYPGYYPPDPNHPNQAPVPDHHISSQHRSSEQRPYEDSSKKTSLKSASQKLAALFEPADEPGRREFVEAILRYWEEKEVPLKNAPLMGRKTVDLFRLYHIVKDRGGMQEVTSAKKWPEISSMLGLGTTTSSGFTLKKQYCKYLYGYECRIERGQPEPQEALTRVTEANRKRKQAMENAEEKARMAAMSPMHSSMMGHPRQPGPYPQQSYPPSQYPQMGHHYPSQPHPAPLPQSHMSPRTMMPPSSYATPPNYSGSTVHHTRAPPPHTYPNPPQSIPPVSGSLPQPSHRMPNSSFPPPAFSTTPHAPGRPPQSQFELKANAPLAQGQQLPTTSLPAPITANSQMPPPPASIALPVASSSSNIPIPVPNPQAVQGVATPPTIAPTLGTSSSSYSSASYDSYSTVPPVRPPKLSSPALPPGARPGPVPFSSPAHSYPRTTAPMRAMSIPPSFSSSSSSPAQANTNQYSMMDGSFPSSVSLSLKRPRSGSLGPPNKMFRPDAPHIPGSVPYRSESVSVRNRYPPSASAHAPYPGSAADSAARGSPGPMRMLSTHSQGYSPYRKDNFPPRFGDHRPSMRWMRPGTLPHRQMYRRPVLKSDYNKSQHIKRQYMIFPPNSVEATPVRLTGFRRKTCANIGLVEGWRLIMALKSGLLVESSWAINTLNILLYDEKSVAQFRLNQLPGLLDALTEHYRRYLSEVFTLPNELEALGISKIKDKDDVKDAGASNRETIAIIRQLKKHYTKKKGCTAPRKLKGKFVKFRVKVVARSNPYLVDRSHDWDDRDKVNIFDDLSHIVVSLTQQKKQKGKRNSNSNSPIKNSTPAVEATLEDILSIPYSLLPADFDNVTRDKNTSLSDDVITCSKTPQTHNVTGKTNTWSTGDVLPTVKQEINLSEGARFSSVKFETSAKKEVSLKSESLNDNQSSNEGSVNAMASDQETDEDKNKSEMAVSADPKVQVPESIPTTNGVEEHAQNGVEKNSDPGIGDKIHISPLVKKNPSDQLEEKQTNEDKSEIIVNGLHGSVSCATPESKLKVDTENLSCENVKTEKMNTTVTEVDDLLKTAEISGPELKPAFKPEVKVKSEGEGKKEKTNSPMPKLFLRVKKLLEDHKVIILEDEAFGRDGSMEDPISGPLLKSKASQSREEVSNRIRSISNILYNLSFIPANIEDLCRHRTFMKALSGILLLRHKHKVRKRKLNSESVVDAFKADSIDDKEISTFTNHKIIKQETTSSDISNAPDVSVKDNSHRTSELFAPKSDREWKQQLEGLSFSSTVLVEGSDEELEEYQDTWWWDSVQRLREDALIILSNLASALNLAHFSDDHVPLAVMDACLHWCLCPSSDACDSYSTKPKSPISPQRLSLEILTKLSIKEDNIDLLLATRPRSRIEKLFKFLINLISDRRDQTLREFAIVLLSNISQSDSDAARNIGFLTGSVSCLVTFLEACEETAKHSQQFFRQPQMMANCGTTPFMMVKAAKALHAMARISENRHKFITYQVRLFYLSMSELLGKHVTAVLSSLLFELGSDSSEPVKSRH